MQDVGGEEEADDEGGDEAQHAIDEPGAQLDQVLDQRGFGGVDVLLCS